jgi:phospholipid transport system substrate-binding protein
MPKKTLTLLLSFIAALALSPLAAGAARAAADPAASQIDAFDTALIETMKQGPALGVKGRYRKLEPVIDRVFDLAAMTRFTVGPAWTGYSPDQQQGLIAAFKRLTVASYAHNFNNWNGERFELDPNVATRGPDKLVQTRLIRTNDSPVSLAYRMRESGGTWKIIDIFSDQISQLTTKRSDFAAIVASGGAPALTARMNTLADNNLK